MDAFDNPARDGMAGPQRDGVSAEQGNQAVAGSELLAASASVTATASAITLAIQAVLVPDASGRIVLPAGVSIDDIAVSGTDLIITLPNGQVMIIPGGAINIPSIVVDGDTVPASTVAQLLENLGDLNPEAGIRSSGGNFADPEGAIQDPYALGDLLPYTELAFPQPEDREIIPAIPEEEDPTVVFVTPDQPAGSVNATSSVNEAGLPVRGNEPAGSNSAANSETVTGSILIDTPDGTGSVTLNGTAITAVGQVITTPIGQLTITSITAGNIGYSYTLTDNTNANNNVTDVFAVVVTDIDGDTATADLTISIIDDVPTARPDTDQVAPASFAPESGNVMTGAGTTSGATGADTQGADAATLTGVTAGTGTSFVAPGSAIQGQYGVLTLNSNGGYTYVRNPNTPGGVSDVFTYRLSDGDGDTSTATLTIAIGDSPNTIDFVPGPGDNTIVNESQLPPRGDESEGSAFDGDDETTMGTITFTSPDGVSSVMIEGVTVTPGSLPQTVFSDETGALVITGYTYDPATGEGSITYNYTLADNALNPGDTSVGFDIVVTDLDGDSATDTLDITIIDDVPTAADDVDSVTEDGPLTADGNVLTGAGGTDANATDGVADTQGADGATVTAVTGGTVGQGFASAYGTLTLNADGSYSYVLNNAAQPVQGLSAGETLTEVFTYTITDGDGDTSTATLTITIDGANDGVTINGLGVEGGEVIVDEDNLIDGSSPDAAALTQPGIFTVSTPDGLGNVTIGGTQVVTNGVFTAGTATSPLGVVNITGFTPVVGADGSVTGGSFTYEYVLSDNTLTHVAAGEDNVSDSFAVVVTDSDGSVGNASLDVVIIDDVPTAANDADSVTEDSGNGDNPPIADGNVLTGVGGSDANATDGAKDVQGADGATVTAVTGGTVGEGFPTTYGTLTLNSDGSYTYVLNNQAQPVQGLSAGETLTEIFTYTITDGDGDTSPATLTITINGADDGVTIRGLDAEGAELRVDEDDLAARAGEAAGSDTTPDGVTDSDSFTVTTPDGMGTVVLDSFNGAPLGAPLTLVVANGVFTPQSVATAYGALNITGFTPVTGQDGSVIGGTFTYTYTLTDNRIDHPVQGQDGLTDSVGVTVTDIDGSTASANIDIRITDDVPTAIDDGLTQSLENQPVTINVLANDVQGADSVQPSAVELVADSLTGTGTLVYNNDGSFTYTPAAQEVGEVSFQYQITDGDGDTSVATATITLIADSAPQFRNPANVVVDEDGLPGANADNGLAGEVTSTGLATADGSITVNFGSDVPATLAGSLVLNDSAALDTQLTVNNVPVTFEKVGNDLVGSVAGNEVIRVALTTPTAGPGATEVTYGYTVTLSQAIDQAVAGSEDTDILSGIGFTVTDSDGTTASGAFGVTIVDDLPTLNVSDLPTSVVEGATANGSWTLDAGADGVTSVNVSFGAGNATLSLTPGSSVSITQPTGTLTVNANGTFSFAAAGNQNNTQNPSASFTLSAVDRDGDPTSDSLTIAITDGANPTNATPITLTVNEAALVDGSTPASPAEVASGNLSFTAGSDTLSGFAFTGVADLVANLDGAGTDIFWTMAAGGQSIVGSLTLGGPAAITISLTPPAGDSIAPGATASATVTVTLADNLPHALAMAVQTQALGTVTVQATDTDGDPATGTVTVQVVDDVPAISTNAAAANALTVDDSDLATNATANFGFGQPGSLFNVAFNADGPAAINSIVYSLGVKTAGVVSGIIDTATGQTVLLTNEAGVIVGRTSGSGEVVFSLSVDANGTVTLDQQRAVFHTPDTGPDQATGLSAADLITLTATITDSDGDPASATANIGGALTFKDDGVNIDIDVVGESDIVLRTQDADTIGATTDTDVSTANFGGAFTALNADFGEDGAGSISWNYALSLFGADGADSQLDSHGASIFLYNVGGVITGSTAASAGAVNSGNTIFALGVNAADGTVTLSQFAQIDHAGPGSSSNFDSQSAVLANELVKLTGTVTIVDKDGDTDSATQSIDLGGNVRFFDDGPELDVTLKGGAELRIDETNGVVATGTEVDPDATGSLGTATIAIADLYTVTADPGADAPTSYSYAFVIAAGDPVSGYQISATNEVIRLYQTGPGTVEGRGETSGNVAFTFTVAANGTVTMTQLIAIEHGNTASNDETSSGMNAGALLLQVTATDFDGDFASDTVDLGSIVRIEDDGPSITNVAGAGSVALDETGGLDANVTSAAAVITANFNFGADGAATANSVVYGLSLTGNGTTSLTTAVGDFAISLVATGSNQITGRYTDGGGTHDAFTVTINANGTVTVSQLVALEHLQDGDTPLHNDALTLNGLINASVTITDSDGDSTTATKAVGGQISFLDDGPSVTANAAGGALVLNDETATSSVAATINTGAIVKGDDPNVGGAGAISTATSGTAVVTATPDYGTDGAAASNPLTYALTVTNATSGLTVTDGSAINLVLEGNVIVGQVSGGAFNGQAAFAIAINPTTGVVTVEQYLSLGHLNAANPDDTLQLLGNTLGVVVTATDSDGDFAKSSTVDISAQIRFDDDGPTISNVAGGASVTLDETNGFDTVVSATPVITADFAYGADGAATSGAAVYGIELTGGGTSVASGIVTAVGDFPITLVEASATTIVGRYTDGGGTHDAFTITIGADGKLTVTQLVALEHLQDGELPLHNDALTLSGLISATVTIKDGDNDTATGKTEIGDQITFLDDGPTANADTNSVIEGAVATGNVLTDNADVFGTDGPTTTSPAGGVVGVRVAGGDTTTPVATGTGTTISTALGDLTLNANGTYSYDAKPNTTSTVVTDTFVYTIRDADGDTSTTTLTITIQPVTLAPDNQTKTVDEAGLDLVADGNDVAAGTVIGSNPTATTETVTGTLAVTGTGVTYAPQTVEDALGKFVLNANGTYTYTLKSAFDGATLDNDVTTENGVRVFNYTATDANGNSVPGTITINIIDDVPTARADTDSVIEDAANPATGNVMTGVGTTNAPGSADTAGADGAAVSGVAAGTPGGDVTGNVGSAVAGTYGSLTLDANGGYTYTLNNGNATVQALGVNESLTETFTYTLTDGDGDRSTTTLTITINGSNDLPTIGTATTAVSDEGLAGGFPDTTGTVDTTNLTVRTGTIVATDPDGDPLTFSLGAPATALSSGGQPIVWDTTNPQLLLGKVGANTIISVSIDNSGNFEVILSGPIDHPNVTLEDALSLVVPVNVNDGTTTITNASALTIGLEDDSPIAIAPLNAQLQNAPGSSVYQSLDTDGDVDNNYGGDGPGSVIFTAATVAALQAQNLTSGSQPLNYVISDNGTVLTAEKPNGDDVFIIRLQPAGHADQYQVQMVQKLDSTVTVDFNDGGYDFVGGNTAWIGFVKPGDNDSQDVLITPMTNGVDGGTMNANATNTGVSSGNSVGPTEAVRIDFVVDLTGSPGNNDYGPLANQNHAFDSHYTANGASAFFSNIQNSSSVRLVARDDVDTDNDIGDGVQDTINKVAISFNNATLFVTANGTYNVGGQSYTVTFSGGQATVTGVTADTRLAGFTADGYNSIEFHHAGGDTFKIGDFGAAVQTENPVNFNVPVTIVDGDGDTAQGSLAITAASPLLVIGSATGDVSGQTTDHVVANPQGAVDGVIQGGNFDDTLVGDPGSVAITEGQQANVVLVLDSSGSMSEQISFGGGTISRMQALKNGVNALIDSLSQSGAQDVRITVIDFDANGTNLGTFNLIVNGVAQAGQVTLAKAAVNGMTASGGTNYEDGLQDALSWINGGNGIAGADVNKVVFVSDGNPTLWNNGGDGSEDSDNVQDAMDQVLGDDGSNEPQQILATGYSIDSIGVNVSGALLTRLGNVEDGNDTGGTGAASNATSAEQLANILQNLGGTTDLAAAGNDTVNGGDGADVMFGDVLFTDALAAQLGVSLPAGSGWAVFQTLEGRPNAESLDPAGNGDNWNRQDTIAYIRANHAILGQESGRTAGNDVINGGAGNDIIYGQEGNDTIDGGAGDDYINGGSGNGTITGGTGNDTIIASTGDGSIVNAGTGADRVTINAGALTSTNWTVNLGSDSDADKIIFNHNNVGDAEQTLVTVSSFSFATDKISIAVNGTSETDGGFRTVTATQTDIGAGDEIIELYNNAWVTTSLGNDGNTSTIEGFIQAATDDIPNGTYTFIVYSNTTATANAGIYSVTISDNTNPGSTGMVVEHIMTINGVGYGNLTAANFVGAADPIILDLNGDGYSFGPTAAFDINADGAADNVTWNSSNDGILAVDLNGNGKIDSGTEIFTPGFGGGTFSNGVAALASLDDNGDGVIDAKDAAFANLLVWQDANADGVSDEGELSTLTDQGITSIATGATSTDETIDGQAVTAHGSFTRADGTTGDYIEVQLDAQLGARGADREAEDAQRTSGNQALTASLVAASLVAMAQGAQAQTDTDEKPVAQDLPTPTPVDDAAAHSVSVASVETAPTDGVEDLSATKNAAPASTSTLSHSDDAGAAAASIDDAQGNVTSDDQGPADTNASDALFDMVSKHADSPMDGLLTLGLVAAGQAAAETVDATVKGATAEAVLAEVLKDGGVDHLIDAVVGDGSQHAANDDAPKIDLAQFLDVKVPADMGGFAHQSIEQDLHQAASHV